MIEMKILITGAFGNLGSQLIPLLLENGHVLRCLTTKSRKSLRNLKPFKNKVEIIFADVRKKNDLKLAFHNQELVIHLAAIVPPRFNKESLKYSREVNVDGIKNIISVIKNNNSKIGIIFPSSVAVYGDVRKKGACILTKNDPINPNPDDIYAQQKVIAEAALKKSGLKWSIFRFGFMPNLNELKVDPMMFDVPLDTNIELIHPKDAALAIANGIDKKEIWGNILLVAGGKDCRITYEDFVGKMLETMGLGRLPKEAYGTRDFHCGFMDTDFSQSLLNYQRHSFQDLLNEMKKKNKVVSFFARLFRPIAKIYLLNQSPYYKEYKKEKRTKK